VTSPSADPDQVAPDGAGAAGGIGIDHLLHDAWIE
jgi:hypothetical protein